jgi:hypothetical protein
MAAVVLPALALVLGGCGGTPFPMGSTTPRVTTDPASPLQSSLVTASALGTLPELASVVALPASESRIFEDPDPRAACGAKIDQPKVDAVVQFQAPDAAAVEGLADVGDRAATRFIDADRADMHTRCPAYESRTNRLGGVQRVVFDGAIPLPALTDDAVASRERISAPGQPAVSVVSIALRRHGVLATFFYFGRPISTTTVVGIAQLLAEPLAALP